MTRFTRRATLPPRDDFQAILQLIGGPTEGGLTEDELELAWRAYGEEATLKRPGQRPWAFW